MAAVSNHFIRNDMFMSESHGMYEMQQMQHEIDNISSRVKKVKKWSRPADDGTVKPWKHNGKRYLRNYHNCVWVHEQTGEIGKWVGVFDESTQCIDESYEEIYDEDDEEDEEPGYSSASIASIASIACSFIEPGDEYKEEYVQQPGE